MTGKNVAQLKDLLRKRVQALGDDALQSGGQVPAEQVEALESLARFVEIYQTMQSPPDRRRWIVAAALLGTLLIASLLLFMRVRETEIELDLALSEVSFVLPSQKIFAESMNLSAFGVSGLREIQLPRADKEEAEIIQADDGAETAFRLLPITLGTSSGSITLGTMTPPNETRIWLAHSGQGRKYRLSLKSRGLKLRADIAGPVQIGGLGRGVKKLAFAVPKAILLEAGDDEVDLDLTLPDTAKDTLSSQLKVSNLMLTQIREFQDPDQTIVNTASTILSGTLFFAALADKERKLRPGEMIEFRSSQGELRTLCLKDDQIELKFNGRVSGMTAGTGDNRRSLMPTWLEWLQARHSLSLLWGTGLYLFGLLIALLRWWGKLR
jgi:hypothetical protein